MIGQTIAIFLDAYRELNARKLFWLTIGLTLLVVGAFACVGINEQGIRLLVWDIPIPFLNTLVLPSKAFFYKLMFFALGFEIWLTWAATILALISTAPLIPDFISSGAIDLSLAKPIGRFRLFLTKYLAGLTFVAIQVIVFAGASYLVLGLRGGTWEPSLFISIPIVLLFFSYLYVVSALIGLITRSTIAALLGAILFWFVVFIIQTTEAVFVLQRVTYDQAAAILETDEREKQARIDGLPPEAGGDAPGSADQAAQRARLEEQLADIRTRLESCRRDQDRWAFLSSIGYAVKTVLPKTGETMGLLERALISTGEWETFANARETQPVNRFDNGRVHGVRVSNRSIGIQVEREMRARSPVWIVGTSLGFEAVLLLGCAWYFCRRDF